MLPHHGAPEAKLHSAATHRANTPLFVQSFIFLTVVLSFQSWQQWQTARHAYSIDIERTLDHYKRQSELIIKAGLHANQIFTRSYGDQLEVYATHPEAADTDDLWGHVSAAIFNATGFFVTDENGKVLNHYGSLLSPSETSDIECTVKKNPNISIYIHFYEYKLTSDRISQFYLLTNTIKTI